MGGIGRFSPLREEEDGEGEETGRPSCWGNLLVSMRPRRMWRLWRRRKVASAMAAGRRKGSFRYDPLSYSQNFDGGGFGEDEAEEELHHGFSARLAALRPPAATKVDGPKAER